MKTYWLSFAEDDGFLGACVIDVGRPMPATGPYANICEAHRWELAAVYLSRHYQINPGGELAIIELANEMALVSLLPRNTLLSLDQVKALGATKLTPTEMEEHGIGAWKVENPGDSS